MSPPKRALYAVVCCLGGLVMAFVLTEAGLRLLESCSPASFYTQPPRSAFRDVETDWNLTYPVNSLGLRNPEVPPRKRPGSVRIVVIGDSFTFGQGCPDEAVFSRRLEAKLNRPDRAVEVVNVSNIGL